MKDRIKLLIDDIERLEDDTEAQHCKSDGIMERLLIELGYEELVEYIRNTRRWYA